jgi:hypothetical protein
LNGLAIPDSPEGLTSDWVTAALQSRGILDPGDRVTECVVSTISEGVGFVGQVARVRVGYSRPQAVAPASLIAKLPGATDSARQIGNVFRFYEREIRFYDGIAEECGMRAPRHWYSAMDPSRGAFVLLIEDLAPARVGDQIAGCTWEEAELAVRRLAQFHAHWWQSPRLDELTWMPVYNDPVHHNAAAAYGQAWQPFLAAFGAGMPEAFRGIAERLATNIIPLMGELSRRPWTMMHGDFRLDNLLFPPLPDGEAIAVIDWQITSRGRGAFDLGYFFCTSMEADVRRKHERDLMDLYFATLVDGGVTDYSREELLRDYRIAALFSLVYTVITLGSLDMGNERGLALFKALLSRNIAAIADYDAGSLM